MADLSHLLSVTNVPDYPGGSIRLSVRDRSLHLDANDARYLATELLKMADALEARPINANGEEPSEEPAEEPVA